MNAIAMGRKTGAETGERFDGWAGPRMPDSARDSIGDPGSSPARLPGIGSGKLIAGSLAFIGLTVGIFWYQFARIELGDASPRWDQLRLGYFALILLLLPVETVASALRIWLLCRVLQPGVSLWTCVKAEWANVAISILTPSQSGGGPGQIYILNRGGASVGTALTISLLSFLGTMVGLLCLGLYSLFVSGIGATGALFAGAVWTLTAIGAAMVLAAAWRGLFRVMLATLSRVLWRLSRGRRPLQDWWPPCDARTGPPAERLDPLAARLADIVYTYGDDVRRFLRHGKVSFAWVCLLSLAFLFSRALMPYLCARFLGVRGSTLGHILEVQMALIFLVFFAPTPGGAGVAEGASMSIMADIVPVGFTPYYNLLWRFSTAYLAAMAGLFCLLRALMQDARKLVSPRGESSQGSHAR
jgi:uncharacterized protein (TIRG00374 family)